MRIERHDDPATFFARVAPFLERREAEHNLQLGFRARLEADRHAFGPADPLLYAVLDDDGERRGGCDADTSVRACSVGDG